MTRLKLRGLHLLSVLYFYGEVHERDDIETLPCVKCGIPTMHRARLWHSQAGDIGEEIAICEDDPNNSHVVRHELHKAIVQAEVA